MRHESLPDEHIEGPDDYVVLFTGGPNHGFVLRGDDDLSGVSLMAGDTGLLPNIGDRFQMGPMPITLAAVRGVERRKMHAALRKVGVTEARMAIYEVESIADGIITLKYAGDA